MRRSALLIILLFWALVGYSVAVGQEYGGILDGSEQQAMTETLQFALENNRTNEAAAWVNPDTDRSGSLVPIRTYQNSEGQYCREYVATIIIAGEEEQGYGTACRQPDGSWRIVGEEAAARPEYGRAGEKTYIVYPYGYPDWYARYPYYGWDYYYPRIFFSFDIVHFSGQRHFHGHHFHGVRHFHSPKLIQRPKQFHRPKQFEGTGRFQGSGQIQRPKQFRGTGQIQRPTQFQNQERFQGSGQFERTNQFQNPNQFKGHRSQFDGKHFKGGQRRSGGDRQGQGGRR